MSLNRIIAIFSAILFLIILVIAFQFAGKISQRFGYHPQPTLPTGKVIIKDNTFTVEIATSSAEQQKGLSDRSSLDDNKGMLFLFDHPQFVNFWMKNMHFPIDIIFINDNTIVSIAENAPAPKSDKDTLPLYSPEAPANKVLEINAGLSKKYKLQKGDKVEISQ